MAWSSTKHLGPDWPQEHDWLCYADCPILVVFAMDQALRDYIISHKKVEIDSTLEDEKYFDFIRYLDERHL